MHVPRGFRLFSYSLLLALLAGTASARAAGPVSDADRQKYAMLEAAEKGDLSAINRLITVGTKVDVRDESNRTPLYMAVEKNRTEAVKLLLAEGADVNVQARDGDTPWLLAGALGRAEILRHLMAASPDLSIRNRFGGSALIPACEKGHLEAVRELLDTAIDLDHVNNLGWTCLLEVALLSDGGARHVEITRIAAESRSEPEHRRQKRRHRAATRRGAKADGFGRSSACTGRAITAVRAAFICPPENATTTPPSMAGFHRCVWSG